MILDDFSLATVVATPQPEDSNSAAACGYCSSMKDLTLVESYSYGTEDEGGERVTMTFDKEGADGVEQSLMFDAIVKDNSVALDNVFLFETSTATPSGSEDGDPIFGSSKHVYFGGLKGATQQTEAVDEGTETLALEATGNNGKCNIRIELEKDVDVLLNDTLGML